MTASIGTDSGTTMLTSMRMSLAPSSDADSYSSSGMLLMK